jgi:hypothetical protein
MRVLDYIKVSFHEKAPYLALLNHLIDQQPLSPGQMMEDVPMHEEEPELE